MKKWMIFMLVLVSPVVDTLAQCAMCRATLENNLSNGKMGIAAGINTGILYLFFAPYLAIGVIAFFWYKTSKKNAQQLKRTLAG
jgi:hypothetical protein